MSDKHNLYFVRILQEAFEKPDKATSLKSALEEINSLGRTPEFREGFENFKKFIQIIDDHAISEAELTGDIKYEMLQSRMIDFITDTFMESAEEKQAMVEFIKNNPELYSEFEKRREELRDFLPPKTMVEIEIERDGNPFGVYRLENHFDHIAINGIPPGEYAIRLSTGLLLWQGRLDEMDILWHLVHPGEKLPAAAETESFRQKATMVIDLMEGEAKLEVFPGLESGTIVLSFRKENEA